MSALHFTRLQYMNYGSYQNKIDLFVR